MDHFFLTKALHIIAVITFMAGLVLNGILFRTLRPGMAETAPLIASARRWNSVVISPALGVVWVLGLTLAYQGSWFADAWLILKMIIVFLLSGLHGAQMAALRKMTEAPTRAVTALLYHSAPISLFAMALIVLLVVLKPF